MTISIRDLFKGLYRRCLCDCNILIPIINKKGQFARFERGHNFKKPNRKYRTISGDYYMIYKPYFKYCNSEGYISEHRYIYHIYLSIKYNRIIYLSKGYDIHHKDENTFNNKISNLQILTRSKHITIHNIDSHISKEDMFKRICNLCKSKTNNKYWYIDINGFLCQNCYQLIRYYRNKFTLK